MVKMKLKLNDSKTCFWILALAGCLSLVIFLGMGLFNTKGEPREAIVALSMLQSGDWICPINNGVDIAYKPPFFHWCVALCSLVAGYVSEFSSRLPSALATILMVLVVYKFMIRNKVSVELSLLTGLVTFTTFEVHRAGMACRVDMLLSAMIVIAIYLFHGWYKSRTTVLLLFVVLSMSAAALTKGPVGILLPCGVMGLFMLVRGENFFKTFFLCLSVALASCVLPFIWYYLAYQERGDAFLYLVYEENVLRFTGKMVYSSHEAPAIYNVVSVITGLLPYTLLFVVFLFTMKLSLPKSSAGVKSWFVSLPHRLGRMSDQDLLSFLSIVVIFVFFCIPKSKRSVYLLPIYPFMAYYIARFIHYISQRNRRIVVGYAKAFVGIAVSLPLLVLLVRTGILSGVSFRGKHAAEYLAYVHNFMDLPYLQIVLFLLFALGVAYLFLSNWKKMSVDGLGVSVAGIVGVVFMMIDGLILPSVYDVKSDYHMAREMQQLVPDGKIWDYRKDFKVGQRGRMHQFSVNFYLGDRIVPLDQNRPNKGYMIMGDDDYKEFVASFPDYELKKIKRFNHKSCDDKRFLTLYSFMKK
ncbi:ArnT family glycosyltransferase [Prevotella pectinovora]|uniref:ArnT family glycosyltransferase n=1 Tax=Prevotella pectinovora TaxID=1602169 RepID=UPI003078AABD